MRKALYLKNDYIVKYNIYEKLTFINQNFFKNYLNQTL